MISVLSSLTMPVRKLRTRSMRKKVSETTLKTIQGGVFSSLKKVMPTGMMMRFPTISSSMSQKSQECNALKIGQTPHHLFRRNKYKFHFTNTPVSVKKGFQHTNYLKSLYGWIIQKPADFTRSLSCSTALSLPSIRRENLLTPGWSIAPNCRCMKPAWYSRSSSGMICSVPSNLIKLDWSNTELCPAAPLRPPVARCGAPRLRSPG
ncbi:hypothetical protein EYF80_007619 [Liparis tanakae]|uniref:Uncharacterized protein n=1 Tax=Liparis tanakae TaxID=230148 RepID=A0A4Z2IXJ1_9TELE|nr:hypothetical protein EYF80_007619 [Liparis tanakae]